MTAAPRRQSGDTAPTPAQQVLDEHVREGRNKVEVEVPEGLRLTLTLPDPVTRASAFCADIVICLVPILLLLALPFGWTVALFIAFILRNVYFVVFELAWGGSTPGKRIVGLRVVNVAAAPLTPHAVIVRNVMREAEFFAPVQILLMVMPRHVGWEAIPAAIWLAFFVLYPIMNSQHRRLGDVVAGTLVIQAPPRALMPDLEPTSRKFTFTDAQMRLYGEDEVHVLDFVLRQPDTETQLTLKRRIVEKIARKVGCTDVPDADADTFLRDFYSAQRAWLERGRLVGKAKRSKSHQG